VKEIRFRVGRTLDKGEESKSGLYAIVSKTSNKTLRVSLIKDIASLITDNSRYIAEAWVAA